MQRNNFSVLSMEPNTTLFIQTNNGVGNSPIPKLLSGEYPGYLHIRVDLGPIGGRLHVAPSVAAVDGDETGWPLQQRKGSTVILNVFGYKHISWQSVTNTRMFMTPLTDH
jgi:hypothetical protein